MPSDNQRRLSRFKGSRVRAVMQVMVPGHVHRKTESVELMKTSLRKIFAPILGLFESGDAEFRYKRSHRTILIAVGVLFALLSVISLVAAIYAAQPGALIPFLVFFSVSAVCLIVGFLGSDRAVAKIWGNR
jgi:hypothetical protein